MRKLLSKIVAYKYPQYIWANDIGQLIGQLDVMQETDHIYDVPCGVGLVAHNISLKIESEYHAYDIDQSKIEFADKYLGGGLVEYGVNNIYTLKFEPNSTWVFVNSLYLLKDINIVIEKNKKNLSYIIGVFPYLKTNNYRYFKSQIDPFLNVNEMDKTETIEFFKEAGYELLTSRDTVRYSYLTYNTRLLSYSRALC